MVDPPLLIVRYYLFLCFSITYFIKSRGDKRLWMNEISVYLIIEALPFPLIIDK
jgi:hypothetical protein